MFLEGIVEDITERQHAEEDLYQLYQDLDQRVKQRTTELDQKNQELERMNRLFVGRELTNGGIEAKARYAGSPGAETGRSSLRTGDQGVRH